MQTHLFPDSSIARFVAKINHELRTPLAVIQGFVDRLVQSEAIRGEDRTSLLRINRNVDRLGRLVDDLIDASRIETGNLKIEKKSFELVPFISEMGNSMRDRIEAKGLELHLTAKGPLPRVIQSDPNRVQQIVLNLLSNATKFTLQGSITLSVEWSGKELCFEVSDTGPGIPIDFQKELFRPFSQMRQGSSEVGSGLGLFISRQLARLVGGTLELVESTSEGTTFRFVLGLKESHELVEAEFSRSESASASESFQLKDYLRNTSVLLVEDCPDNRLLTGSLLRIAGAKVDVAVDGREAVDKACAKNASYDVIIMDIGLPVLSGEDAIKEIRLCGRLTPIVVLTANAGIEESERLISFGCDEYLVKPVRPDTLMKCMGRFRQWQRVLTEGAPAKPPKAFAHVARP